MCDIDAVFVEKWSEIFDTSRKSSQAIIEDQILDWMARQPEPKFLNKEYFVKIGRWKTRRYNDTRKAIPEKIIVDVTRRAYDAQDDRSKIEILMALRGVGTGVASAILYFMDPERYPLFDFHVRVTLKERGCWKWGKKDSTKRVWLEYVGLTRRLANRVGVDLRTLEKSLIGYDKYGKHRSPA